MALTYSNYLKLDQLLSLQDCKSEKPEHDEMLFIVIHQVYELWFKEVLHELDHAMSTFRSGDAAHCAHSMKRVLKIFKVLVAQLDVLETMTPLEFQSFRECLETASGFQSAQFRELEMVMGLKRGDPGHLFDKESDDYRRLSMRQDAPTLWDAILVFLEQKGHAVPDEVLRRDVTRTVEPSEAVQAILIDVYKNDPSTAQVCELLVDLDEGLQEWRYRHVKMVERTIGAKPGTGKSSGAEYLKKSLFKPAFPDLWIIRSAF